MVAMPMRETGNLVNRVDHRALQAITNRLQVVASQLKVSAQKKERKQKAQAQEPVAKAA